MTDISTIDVPTLVTAVLTIVVSAGGVIGKTYIGKTLSGVTALSEGIVALTTILGKVQQLLITLAKAGEDGVLSQEEWASIKDQGRAIQAELLVIQGKLTAFKI